jgi:hypothetical protein
MHLQRAVWVLAVGLGGCGFFKTQPPVDGGGPVGFLEPTLLLTINGVQFRSVPDSGSGADIASTQNPTTGLLLDTTLTIQASSSSTGAFCQFSLQRFGNGLVPWRAGVSYALKANTAGATSDGTASPIAGETVGVPQGTWSCTGSGCDGAVLVLSYLAADHIEGFLTGTFASSSGAGDASVVCSFYLPMRSYNN